MLIHLGFSPTQDRAKLVPQFHQIFTSSFGFFEDERKWTKNFVRFHLDMKN